MKQTVEEAAISSQCEMGCKDCPNHAQVYVGYYSSRNVKCPFILGAEWQSKQSPWISVEERLPEPNKEVLLYDKNSIRHYVIGWLRRDKGYNEGMWRLSNGWVEDKGITHWMPIDEPITE